MAWEYKNESLIIAAAAQQWEITKGHIRASVALKGNAPRSQHRETSISKYNDYLEFQKQAEQFIKEIEGNELHLPK